MCYTINKCVAKLNITSLFFAFKVLFAIKVLASFVKEVPFFDLMCGYYFALVVLHSYTRFRNSCFLLSLQQRIHRKFETCNLRGGRILSICQESSLSHPSIQSIV